MQKASVYHPVHICPDRPAPIVLWLKVRLAQVCAWKHRHMAIARSTIVGVVYPPCKRAYLATWYDLRVDWNYGRYGPFSYPVPLHQIVIIQVVVCFKLPGRGKVSKEILFCS